MSRSPRRTGTSPTETPCWPPSRSGQPVFSPTSSAQSSLSPAAELASGDETAAARLTSAIIASAHGHAMLMLDGTFGSGHHAAEAAAEQAAAATLALISGRDSLTAPATPH